jgi:hypothetical protein
MPSGQHEDVERWRDPGRAGEELGEAVALAPRRDARRVERRDVGLGGVVRVLERSERRVRDEQHQDDDGDQRLHHHRSVRSVRAAMAARPGAGPLPPLPGEAAPVPRGAVVVTGRRGWTRWVPGRSRRPTRRPTSLGRGSRARRAAQQGEVVTQPGDVDPEPARVHGVPEVPGERGARVLQRVDGPAGRRHVLLQGHRCLQVPVPPPPRRFAQSTTGARPAEGLPQR